ncbi:MAG: hypothetical protein V4719_22015 [Planctomycetota bacterium]
MPTAREWFEDFTSEEFNWSGDVYVEFWFARMRVHLDKLPPGDYSPVDGPPVDRQFEILDAIIQYRADFMTTLERALFRYYQESAYGEALIVSGGVDITDRAAPELHSPAEIWKLIRAPRISIPRLEDDSHDVLFLVIMNCTWNMEHGVCVVVRNWEIADDEVGQIGEFYDVFRR